MPMEVKIGGFRENGIEKMDLQQIILMDIKRGTFKVKNIQRKNIGE
jgi:hypothetical protein